MRTERTNQNVNILLGMLSIRQGWDHYLVILACLFSLYVCSRILWEEYSPNFHRKKGDGAEKQSPSEPDKPSARSLGEHCLQGHHPGAESRDGGVVTLPVLLSQVFLFVLNSVKKFLDFALKLIGGFHVHHQMPGASGPSRENPPGSP